MRILVVEDEVFLAAGIVEYLEAAGYAVDLVGSGEAALELRRSSDHDLVILDWSIPPPTGIELIRGWRGAGDEVPVILMTGSLGIDERSEGLEAGADRLLAKPFRLGDLLAAVRALIGTPDDAESS